MSGRKVSIYDLPVELRENCLEQLDCIRESWEIYRETEQAMAELEELIRTCAGELDVMARIDPQGEVACGLREILDLAEKARSRVWAVFKNMEAPPVKAVVPTSPQDTARLDKLRAIRREMRAAVPVVRSAMEEMARARDELDDVRIRAALRRRERAEEIRGGMDMNVSFDIGEACGPDERPDTAPEEQRLLTLAEDAYLSDKSKAAARNAAAHLHDLQDPELIANYLTVTVGTLEKALRRESREEKAAQAARKARYQHYCALCDALGDKPLLPEGGAAADVEQAIRVLEERLADRAGQDYIGEAIRQVMREMGYDMLGERDVTKRSGRTFHSEIFRYGEGQAISVTRNDQGQIAMEMGGLNHGGAAPDEQEADRLSESMGVFCQDFKELERRLLRHGVRVHSRMQDLPAGPQYAVMIDLDDYGLTDGSVSTLADVREEQAAPAKKASEVDT